MSLDGITDSNGRFCVLAIDHRDSLRAFLEPEAPETVSGSRIVELKIELVRAVAPEATGVMLEPEYSIPQVIDAGALPEGVGFIAALEAQGYLDDPEAAPTRLLEGWSVEAAAASGAAAVKLLVPYRPDGRLADAQESVAADVIADCRRVGTPLVLEPLFYGPAEGDDRRKLVTETVARFAALGPDVLKLPFPVDVVAEPDRTVWFEACREISEQSPMPWALLSGGGSFQSFREQLAVAIDAGCDGFMVGRALWGEAARAPDHERPSLIAETVVPRFRDLRSLVL